MTNLHFVFLFPSPNCLYLVFTHVMRRPCWCTKQWENAAQVLHNNRNNFFAIVLYTNMAAVTSRANREYQRNSRIVRTHSAIQRIWNNPKVITETQSYILGQRSHWRRSRLCLSSLLTLHSRTSLRWTVGNRCFAVKQAVQLRTTLNAIIPKRFKLNSVWPQFHFPLTLCLLPWLSTLSTRCLAPFR